MSHTPQFVGRRAAPAVSHAHGAAARHTCRCRSCRAHVSAAAASIGRVSAAQQAVAAAAVASDASGRMCVSIAYCAARRGGALSKPRPGARCQSPAGRHRHACGRRRPTHPDARRERGRAGRRGRHGVVTARGPRAGGGRPCRAVPLHRVGGLVAHCSDAHECLHKLTASRDPASISAQRPAQCDRVQHQHKP